MLDKEKIRREAEESADRNIARLEGFFRRNSETVKEVGAALGVTYLVLIYLCFIACWSAGLGVLAALLAPRKEAAELVFYLAFWLAWVRSSMPALDMGREAPSFPLLLISYFAAVVVSVVLVTEVLLPKALGYLFSLL